MSKSTRLRFAIHLLCTTLLFALSVAEIVEALSYGVATLPLSKRGDSIRIVQEANPVIFLLVVLGFTLFAALSGWYGWRQFKAIMDPDASENSNLIRTELANLERAAPSGLRPLGWGLGIAFVIALLYVLLTPT